MTEKHNDLVGHRVPDRDELAGGQVTSMTCEHHTLRSTRHKGRYAALDNKCPRQGGSLGEGSIENDLLRCPWHRWGYDPISGKTPGFEDGVNTSPIEARNDGFYVGLPKQQAQPSTVADLMMETIQTLETPAPPRSPSDHSG